MANFLKIRSGFTIKILKNKGEKFSVNKDKKIKRNFQAFERTETVIERQVLQKKSITH